MVITEPKLRVKIPVTLLMTAITCRFSRLFELVTCISILCAILHNDTKVNIDY